jgi:predicted nucleic acid-binding protein
LPLGLQWENACVPGQLLPEEAFDDQTQMRIHLESEAVLSLMHPERSELESVHASAHDLENDQNPVAWRAARVRRWLQAVPLSPLSEEELVKRTKEIQALGFKNFDAFHLASAELSSADRFVTCDDRLLAAARRHAAVLKIRVIDPIELTREIP